MKVKMNDSSRSAKWRWFFLSLLLVSFPLSADESRIIKLLANWLPAETLLDNTDRGTAKLEALPGWVLSGKTFKNAFGMTFKTGPSEYLLRSVSFLVGAPEDAAEFDGDLKVSLYEVPEGKFPPSDKPFFESTLKGVSIRPKERYITLPLALPSLRPGTWYGIALTAPNDAITRVMGYQVPPRAPTPSLGFEVGPSLWGEPGTWRSLGPPYIWLEGWDAASERYSKIKAVINGGFWLLLGLAVLWSLNWLRHRGKK
jgi:hypothetical protein